MEQIDKENNNSITGGNQTGQLQGKEIRGTWLEQRGVSGNRNNKVTYVGQSI